MTGNQWPYAITAALIVGLMMVTLYLRYERPRRRTGAERDRFVADAAARRGWSYAASAPRVIDDLAHPPFDRGVIGGHRVHRVVTGTSGSLRFRAFDLEQERFVGEYSTAYRYAVFAVTLRRRATSITIAPAALLLDAGRRAAAPARHEPFLEVPAEGRGDIRIVAAARDLAEAVAATVIAVLDDAPGFGWSIDGDIVLLIRGGEADPRTWPRHWVDDVEEGIALLRRIDRTLPESLLDGSG
ncbi:MAG: hypothetical protein NTX33_07050 [Propionibacteriales bacterium]|nr:hypothetical protein [Propionibacteriales bacterium]